MAGSYIYSDYSKLPCRTIKESFAQIIHGEHLQIRKRRYIIALCGSIEEWPARLRVYKDEKTANEESSVLQEILFTDVINVEFIEMRQIQFVKILMLKGKSLSFYADSHTSTMEWYQFCGLLFKIPKNAIPEIPKENIALLQGIHRYSNSHKHSTVGDWVVNILSEGIGGAIKVIGLCVVYICNETSTFNVLDFYTGKCLLTWHRDGIKRSGCIESLVFVEATGICRGGPGLLWMQYPMPHSATLQKHIHDFLFSRPNEPETTSPICYVFVDSATSSAYIKDDNDQQLSQTPYDQDQLSDTSSAGNTPMSQSGSLSSGSSQYSSGYYSDSSNSEFATSESSKLPHPIVAYKHTDGQKLCDKSTSKKPSITSFSPIQTVYPTVHDDESSCLNSNRQAGLENGSLQKRSASPYGGNKNTTHISLQKHSYPPQSSSTKTSMIPKPPSGRPLTTHCTSCGYHSSYKVHLSTPPLQFCDLSLKENSSTAMSSCGNTNPKHQLAFQGCSVKMVENLDVLAIFPNLNSQGLLTQKDRQILLNNKDTTNTDKVHYLLDALPRKEGFFDKFLHCLYQTTNGTGHRDIAMALSSSYTEVMGRNSQATMLIPSPARTSPNKEVHKYHSHDE